MKILAIECTHQLTCVAVKNGSIVVERNNEEWQKTAEAIVPLVIQAMSDAGVTPVELDGIAVSSGPGSFTALRIGMSAAKGIAFGAGRPLVPVPTMQAMADSACSHTASKYLVTVIPSRPGEYFYSVFSRDGGNGMPKELESSRCLAIELSGRLDGIAGEFVLTGRAIEELAGYSAALAPYGVEASFFNAASLLPYAEKALADGVDGILAEAVPDYRQQFVPGQQKQ
ncbi:MAG: tRNA (adenosine(37)-N6)-threonylcarbamoyltransferase complex dimerization subunit type 1 TsaB [Chlorobiaceae bacterium]|nr:tRNA (adenosine(37)-N6)-threonylcarbamoyltransferase complex dimerization subunit type 1 TsaB [Chlorobiaceae bacterium]